jgi:hypothetical protein
MRPDGCRSSCGSCCRCAPLRATAATLTRTYEAQESTAEVSDSFARLGTDERRRGSGAAVPELAGDAAARENRCRSRGGYVGVQWSSVAVPAELVHARKGSKRVGGPRACPEAACERVQRERSHRIPCCTMCLSVVIERA